MSSFCLTYFGTHNLTDEELGELHNSLSNVHVSKVRDREAMIHRTRDLLRERGYAVWYEDGSRVLYQVGDVYVWPNSVRPNNPLSDVVYADYHVQFLVPDVSVCALHQHKVDRLRLMEDGMRVGDWMKICQTVYGGDGHVFGPGDVKWLYDRGLIRLRRPDAVALADARDATLRSG